MKTAFKMAILFFAIILCLFSLIAFLSVHLDLLKQQIQLNSKGFNNYFEALGEYKELFAGTITLITAYFAIERLHAAEIANRDKVKLDRFSDWKLVTDLRMSEIKESSNVFKREFSKSRYKFYDDLYKLDMIIKNKSQLEQIYNTHFHDLTRFFEENSKGFIDKGIYPSLNSSYFADDFYFVFAGCTDKSYSSMKQDFHEIYISKLDPERIILDFKTIP